MNSWLNSKFQIIKGFLKIAILSFSTVLKTDFMARFLAPCIVKIEERVDKKYPQKTETSEMLNFFLLTIVLKLSAGFLILSGSELKKNVMKDLLYFKKLFF